MSGDDCLQRAEKDSFPTEQPFHDSCWKSVQATIHVAKGAPHLELVHVWTKYYSEPDTWPAVSGGYGKACERGTPGGGWLVVILLVSLCCGGVLTKVGHTEESE